MRDAMRCLKMDIVGKITVYSAAFGALAGVVSGVLSHLGVSAWAGLFIAILFICILVYKLIPFTLGIAGPAAPLTPTPTPARAPAETQGQQLPDKRKIFSTGFWPFFVMWLVLWIMVYTLFV
jgi:hypothetical protein